MDSAQLYKSVIMEVRPRLQSVNVFVTLTAPIVVHVNLNLDNFELVVGSLRQKVQCRGFHVVPNSLSCLINKEDYVTFRFSTENIEPTLGTSRFELVEINKQTDVSPSSDIFIKPQVHYTIKCGNCSQPFSRGVTFERVLPLPENSDMSEWFCHAHGNDDNSQTLVPKSKEAFYSHCFVHLHRDLLTGFVNGSSLLICKRCLAWVGTKLRLDVHKIWLNTVLLSDGNSSFKSAPLDDAFKTIAQILNGSLLSSSRIVLNCDESNSQTSFLLLWIMEKRLQVCFDCGESTQAHVSKVIFKFDKTRSDLVCQWLSDVNVSTVDLSKPMMVKLLEHLYDMNRFIPKDFSISNDFYISYLMLYKDN